MSPKTARTSAVSVAFLGAAAIAVNTAPASAPMTFREHPDGFAGPVAHHAAPPIWREKAVSARYSVQQVRCAAPAAVAAGTACFVPRP